MKSRCEIIFEQSIKSEYTKKQYLYMMKKFMNFVGVDTMDGLLQYDEKAAQEKVEDFIIFLKGKINPNSFKTQMCPIFLFYALNDIILNKTKIRKMYPSRIKTQGFNAYTKEDIKIMLENTNKKRTKVIIIIFASTGCRLGGLCGLKIGDVEPMENSDCKSVRFYTGTPEEYIGFLTPEAVNILDDYLNHRIRQGEVLTADSPLIKMGYKNSFTEPINGHQMSNTAVMNLIGNMFKRERAKDKGGRFQIPTTHGFRKYFNKTLKMRQGANLSICERLLGHSTTIALDNNYLPLSRDDLFAEFNKAIPELTIRDDERYSLRIKELEENRRKEEDLARQNKELLETTEILKLRIERLKQTIER